MGTILPSNGGLRVNRAQKVQRLRAGQGPPDLEPTADKEWQRQMKRNVIGVLQRTAVKVSGDIGAAQLLGLKPTTLASRLRKWGIDPRQYKLK